MTGPVSVRESVLGGFADAPAHGVMVVLKDGKPEESGVVSTDGTRPVLSPKLDAIAYLDQGLAMVRTLTKVDRKAYDDALRAQTITALVGRAKQVGTAIAIYATDLDDRLPGQDGDINDKLMPYLKNSSLLEGFTYTFGGGALADIDKPADTPIGYIAGPGGRAVVYADSHAKWVPDGP